MEQEEHTVVINQYARLILTIPKELSIVELNGLALLAKKVSNISDVGGIRRTYNKSGNYSIKKKGTGNRYWTEEMMSELTERMNNRQNKQEAKGICEDLARKFGLTAEQVSTKWGNMRHRGH